MHRIRMHPPLLLFSRDSLDQSPGSLFGSPAASFWRPVALRSPASRRGCPSRSASKEDAPTNFIIRFSGISRQHFSESQCLGAELPLLTELPIRVLLGNRASDIQGSRKLGFRQIPF